METAIEQKILRVNSRAQSNTPNIDDYLQSGWVIKFAFFIEAINEIQYIIERSK